MKNWSSLPDNKKKNPSFTLHTYIYTQFSNQCITFFIDSREQTMFRKPFIVDDCCALARITMNIRRVVNWNAYQLHWLTSLLNFSNCFVTISPDSQNTTIMRKAHTTNVNDLTYAIKSDMVSIEPLNYTKH